MGIYDVPASKLIEVTAQDLKKKGVQPPDYTDFVKTGSSRERAPLRGDWWHVRLSSMLYRVFKDGPLGTGSLRTYYGGRKARGTRPHVFKKASGKILRNCLQELEKQGFVKKAKKGRTITGKGQSYLNEMSKAAAKAIAEEETHREDIEKAREKKRIEKEKELAAEKRVEAELKKQEKGMRKDKKKKKPEKKKEDEGNE